jgi:hypothetical protein
VWVLRGIDCDKEMTEKDVTCWMTSWLIGAIQLNRGARYDESFDKSLHVWEMSLLSQQRQLRCTFPEVMDNCLKHTGAAACILARKSNVCHGREADNTQADSGYPKLGQNQVPEGRWR